MRVFKYDVIQLITAIHKRPCLWDKTVENYKDRTERRAAWEEVFTIVDDGYNDLSAEDKRITGEKIICKWTNIRDTFVKSLRSRMGAPKRKYVYYDHLTFLLKSHVEDNDTNGDSVFFINNDNSPKRECSRKRSRRTEHVASGSDYEQNQNAEVILDQSQSDNEIEQSVLVDTNDARVMNEDEAFFASLLPTVVKYNEDDRLEFRMEVLGVMKKIRDKRHWSSKIE
ncbi:uncharacterized protein LOC123714859 [Pieris brassicae]|uniref:MADF domain-containing protein n=1 Tax=Pieris brassicae TaxID=7116 RepID=A0A9P0TL21_PIEBR|nr:uncharacterized protein LOC123714859 [Pieris brassicae]CAH4032747.1 unnamed protein product [Pieris brassicae]